MHVGFAPPAALTQARRRHGVRNRRSVCMLVSEAHVMMDTMATQGFPILESFKGVFIGPTINEIAAAVAGGTVGVMGTLLALETGRQRAMERKQCPYCRGKGRLACGHCYAIGAMPSVQAVSGQRACEHCKFGFIECNHVRTNSDIHTKRKLTHKLVRRGWTFDSYRIRARDSRAIRGIRVWRIDGGLLFRQHAAIFVIYYIRACLLFTFASLLYIT